MVDQSIVKKEDKTKYLHIEVILSKGAKYDVISGLFKGIVEKENDKFILLHGLKDSTNVLNLRYYNIMTVEELSDDYKNMTYLTAEETDQTLALEMVEKLYSDLIAAGKALVNDPTVIDIEKYEEVPKEYLEGKPLEKDTISSPTSSVGSFASPCTRYSSGVTYTKTVVKKDPEPTLLSRTNSKKPTKPALDLMEEKITQIMAGTFVPVLPETMGEDADGKATADDTDTTDVDYYGNTWGMC